MTKRRKSKYPPCDLDCFNCTRPVSKCHGGDVHTAGVYNKLTERDKEIRARRKAMGKIHSSGNGCHKITKKGSYLNGN